MIFPYDAVYPFPFLNEEQMVWVADGPLMGCQGFLLKIKEEKEKMVISALQELVSVEMEGARAEPINF